MLCHDRGGVSNRGEAREGRDGGKETDCRSGAQWVAATEAGDGAALGSLAPQTIACDPAFGPAGRAAGGFSLTLRDGRCVEGGWLYRWWHLLVMEVIHVGCGTCL